MPGEIRCVPVPGDDVQVSVPGEMRCLCQVRSGVCAR